MKITIFAEKSVQNKTNRLNINENKTSDNYDDNPVSRTDRPVSFNQFFFCAGA